jgi:hypothetical protein
MVRRWAVRPDQELHLQDGRTLYIVSRDARVAAFVDAEAVQEQCGGFISVQSVREPTEIPGEMVTTMLLVEWRDRTDAKEQPERQQPVPVAAPVEPPAPTPEPESQVDAAAVYRDLAEDPVGDGLDESALEEEDLDSVPESVR